MAHHKHPILGGLALGLVLLALQLATAATPAAEYSGATLPGLALRDAPASSIHDEERLRIAQSDSPASEEDARDAEARRELQKELDRMRRNSREGNADTQSKTKSSKPVIKKGKEPAPRTAEAVRPQQAKQPVHTADTAIGRATGKLIIMRFSGDQPADAGPKAIHALLQAESIAGVMLTGENIQAKGQLKELIKFLWQGSGETRPIFAIREIGGASDALPHIKDFEAWPSEQEVAAKGDPEYAYSTYRSLSSNLAYLGFNMNFGPALGSAGTSRDPAATFGGNPLQAGVFAKTFVLGHKEENIIPVPIIDSSDTAVRALKTLLVSYPGTPIAATMTGNPQPFAAYDSLVRGARFCFVTFAPASDPGEAADSFSHGCDALVVDGGKENPSAIRDLIVRGVSDAISSGKLSLEGLNASAQRLQALRSPAAASSFTTRTSQ